MSSVQGESQGFRLFPADDLFLFGPKEPMAPEPQRRLYQLSLRSWLLVVCVAPPLLASAISSWQSARHSQIRNVPKAAVPTLRKNVPVRLLSPAPPATLPQGPWIEIEDPLPIDYHLDR